MSYEQLDLIADTFIPILILILFFFWVRVFYTGLRSKNYRVFFAEFIFSLTLMVIVYLFLWFDTLFFLFHRVSLDYSTHTALSSVLSINLILLSSSKRLKNIVLVGLVSYFLLMLYQQYHTIMDIVITLVFLFPVILICVKVRIKILNG